MPKAQQTKAQEPSETAISLPALLDLETCKKLLAEYRGPVLRALARAQDLQVTDSASNKLAVDTILEIKTIREKVDKVRKDLGKTAREYVSSINNLAGPFLEELNGLETALRAKADAYAETIGPEKTRGADGSRHGRTKWGYECEDISKVPADYLMTVLNDALIQASIDAGVRVIPGLRIFSKNKGIYRRNS